MVRCNLYSPLGAQISLGSLVLGDFESLGEACLGDVFGMYTVNVNLQWLGRLCLFLHTPLAACARPEGQPVPSSVPLWRPHSAHSSWRLQACGVGRPVIDDRSRPN